MNFPRRSPAGQITDGTFRGINLLGRGTSGTCSVDMNVEGQICDLSWEQDTAIDDFRKAVNDGMRGALCHLQRHWHEYGMDVADALEIAPYLDPTPQLRAELARVCRRMSKPLRMSANAVPEITELQDPGDDRFETLLMSVTHMLAHVLRERSAVIRQTTEAHPLAHDVATHRWFEGYLRDWCGEMDEDRLMVMMPVGQNGNRHFVNSALQIIMQANQVGRKVDMLLGLNQVDYPREVAALGFGDTDVTDLYVNEDASNGMTENFPLLLTEDVFTDPSHTGPKFVMDAPDPDRNRIFAVRQQRTKWNAGKNPLQRVMVRMLIDRVMHMNGPIPGEILLADADSWFVERPADRDVDNMDILTNGLGAMLREKDNRNLTMIGARCRSAQYAERTPGGEKIPDFGLPVSDIYQFFDASAPKNLKFMVGGGTLGDFPTVLSLLSIICHRYPGSRVEDLHYSVIAERAGVPWGVSEKTCVSNEVRQESLDQPQRWLCGSQGLRDLYRNENPFVGLVDSKGLRSEFSCSRWRDTLQTYESLVAYGKQHPDDVVRGNASWNA